MRWFRHVVRREAKDDIRVAYEMEVEGARLRGRPKKRWRDQLRKDMQEMEIREKEAQDTLVENGLSSRPLQLRGNKAAKKKKKIQEELE